MTRWPPWSAFPGWRGTWRYLPIRQGVALVDRNELLVLVER